MKVLVKATAKLLVAASALQAGLGFDHFLLKARCTQVHVWFILKSRQ